MHPQWVFPKKVRSLLENVVKYCQLMGETILISLSVCLLSSIILQDLMNGAK